MGSGRLQEVHTGCYRETPSPRPSSRQHDDSVRGGRNESGDEEYSPQIAKGFQPHVQVPLLHRWRSEHSIMSLVTWKNYVFASTESGEILVYDLISYQLKYRLEGHKGSIYSMVLAENRELLISGSADSLVKVWCLRHFRELYSIYSNYDIGDVFSLAWAPESQTVYLGSQNASIQWVHLSRSLATKDVSGHPALRFNRFFDSSGPGGKRHPAQEKDCTTIGDNESATMTLIQIPLQNVQRYAHNGFVYSMLSLVHSEHGELLVSGAGDGTIKIWKTHHCEELSAGQVIGQQPVPTFLKGFEYDAEILSLCASNNNSYVYAGLSDGQVIGIDMDTLQVLKVDKLKGFDRGVMTLSIFNESLFKGIGGTIQKWQVKTYQRCNIDAHSGLILSSAINCDENQVRLITGGNDSTIALWDITEVVKKVAPDVPHVEPSNAPLNDDNMIKTLGEFVGYNTVSCNPQSSSNECRKCASYLRSLLRHFGAEANLLSVEPDLNPILYARFPASVPSENSKRILFYGHYDVISADSQDNWENPPFQMTAENGYLYGRGVSDNKGPVLAAIFAAAELFQSRKLKNDLIFLIEGEEECGSQGFVTTVEKHRETIGDIDWIILSNSYWINDDVPCLNYGLRGIVNMTLEVSSGQPDLHSGVHGGVFREPTFDMVSMLSKLASNDGKILIPSFYDSVREIDASEEEWYNAIVNTPGIEESKESLMKKWRFPSLTIHRLYVSGPGNSTVIPATVSAALSFRVVPDQKISQIEQSAREFLTDEFNKMGTSNKLSIKFSNQAAPWLGDPTNDAFQILRNALKEEWDLEPLFIREGGSIPVVRALEQIFEAPAAQLPCGQASDGAHLNNERLRVTNFVKTRRVLLQAFEKL